jgi:prohibitin 1
LKIKGVKEMDRDDAKFLRNVVLGAVALLGLVVVLLGWTTVQPGERAVSVSFGKASDQVLDPGIYLRLPLVRTVTKMNVQIQRTDVKDAPAASRDMQEIHTHVVLNWHILPDDTVKIYKTIGTEDDVTENIIVPVFNEILKAATAKKTAEEVLTKRAELKQEIDDSLTARLKSYGVFVDDVNIIDIQFSEDFTKAIEAKQVAEQRSKQASYEAEKASQDAQAEINKAKGQAEAQRLLMQSLSGPLLKLRAIEKWDGHFPAVMGSGTLPMLDLKSIQDAKNTGSVNTVPSQNNDQ